MISQFSEVGTSNLSEFCGDYNNPWLYLCLFTVLFFPLAVVIILYTFEKLSGCHNKGVNSPRRLSLYYWICIWIFFSIEKICPSCCGYHGTYHLHWFSCFLFFFLSYTVGGYPSIQKLPLK